MVNQTAYDVWENANLFVGGVVVTPAAIGANAARAAGTNVTRAVVTEIGKTTLSAGIGAVSGKAGTYFGTKFCGENVCHYVGLATGILGGVVGYGSLGAVDSHFNISGTHGFASAMSPEDAVRYEDFLKNGSQEGLTEAEVQGIAKVDEQLALNKVNYDEVLEMRRVSNGTETSYAQSIEISEEKMYKLGSHFNKHGRNMGFGSKKEYETAARDFFQKNKNNAEIYVGKYNSPRGGILDGTEQVIIQYEGKSLVINKRNGQIIDFYDGIGMKAFVDLERKQ